MANRCSCTLDHARPVVELTPPARHRRVLPPRVRGLTVACRCVPALALTVTLTLPLPLTLNLLVLAPSKRPSPRASQGPAAVPPAFHGSFNPPPAAATTPMHPLHSELHSALTGTLSGTPQHATLGSTMHAPHPTMHGARMLHPGVIAGALTGVHTPHAMPPPRGAVMMGNGLAGQQQLSLPLSVMRAAPHSQQLPQQQLSQHLLQQQHLPQQHLPPPQQLTQQHLQQQLLSQQQRMPQHLPLPQQQQQQLQQQQLPQQQRQQLQQQQLPQQRQQQQHHLQQHLQIQQQQPSQLHLSQQQLLVSMDTAAPPIISGMTPLTQPAMTADTGARPPLLSFPLPPLFSPRPAPPPPPPLLRPAVCRAVQWS